jgi:hypothetical protein
MRWVGGIIIFSAVSAAAPFADQILDRVEWVLFERDSPLEPDDRSAVLTAIWPPSAAACCLDNAAAVFLNIPATSGEHSRPARGAARRGAGRPFY